MPRSLNLTAIRTVLRNADKLGAKIPKTAASDFETLLAIIDRSDALKAELSHDIGAKVVAALEAGTDPLDDPAVQQAAVRTVLTDRFHAVDVAVDERTDRYLDDHALALLGCFAGPFDRAAATIESALDRLGDVPITDTKAVARKGPDAAAAWAEVQEAEQTITTITQTWKVLSGVARSVTTMDRRYGLLVFADVPAATFVAERLGNQDVSPWDAARRGWPLSLAMPDELARRTAALRTEVARLNADQSDAFRRGYQKMHGTGVATG